MAKVGYITIGASDLERALGFYDALLGAVGGARLMKTPKGQAYRLGSGPMIMVTTPYDDGPATAGNGTMLAIQVDTEEEVAALHAKALELGGTCEGQPGPRGNFGTFSYFRDLDGNKLCACKFG